MKTETQRRASALKWLSIVRQASVDDETSAAYVTALEDMPAEAVQGACKVLGFRAHGEFETAWPDLATIRAECRKEINRLADAAQLARLLAMPKPPELTEEEQRERAERGAKMRDQFLADLRKICRSKVMR